MRKILPLFLVLYLMAAFAQAQCLPCPRFFNLTDSINCVRTELSKNCSSNGSAYVNCATINACKNSRQVYTLTPVGFDLSTGAPCVYPPFTYGTPSITSGTIVSYGGNQITIQWGNANSAVVLIPFSTPSGSGLQVCTDTMRLNVNLLNNPVAAFTASPQPACFNNPTHISFNSSASVGAVSYFWNFGDGFTSTLPNPIHPYANPGTYTVCLTVSTSTKQGGAVGGASFPCPTCFDSVCQTVVIDTLPGPPIECVATVCAGQSETYCTSAAGCSGYVWSVVGGTITSGQGTSCVTVLWGSGNPQGSLTLVATGCTTTYCPQGTTVNIPIIPTTTNITGSNPVCVGTVAAYSLPAFPGTTYSWNLSGGGSIVGNNTNTNQINVNWNTVGSYTITCNYYDTALKCGGVGTITVNVLPVLRIAGSNKQCQGTSSVLQSFFGPPNTGVPSNWTISPAGATVTSGNGTFAATINWASPGVYTVTATPVSSGVVCGPASYTVTVFPSPVISAVTGPDSICRNQTYVYAAVSNASGLFSWSVTNGTFVTLGSNNDSVQVTWGNTGPYSLSVSQTSYANNCLSNTFVKNVFPYPTPAITGPVSVCADAIVNYTITNITGGNFNWYVTPASFGTILSGQGTSTISIKWHGNNNPGGSNTVYLHFGVCGTDSVAITINEPVPANITASGTLCLGGITLSTGATGTFSWSCLEHAISPAQPTNLSSLTGLNLPGTYTVQIQNYNGSGCTVSATYSIPNIGLPVASISATGPLNYCLPSLPNMSLVALPGVGYTYQWYQNAVLIPGATTSTLGINTGSPSVSITTAGTYTFYCVVTLGGCVVSSNTITITVSPGPCPGCTGAIQITNITGCNPFTISIAAISPSAYIIPGTTSILHWIDNTVVGGNVTNTFTVAGFQPVRICASVKNNDSTTCTACRDTTLLVPAAANFIANDSCGIVTLTDLSSVVAPAVINSYNWSVGTNPGNLPTFNATFNNNTIASPIMTVTASGSYIITQTITSGSCTITHMDTVQVNLADATFAPLPTCVGTPAVFNNPPSFTDFWDFGDAATSYVSPTTHAYAAPGVYPITHIVTNGNGCSDTAVKNILIFPAPTCTIIPIGPTTFCFGDSVQLKGCGGYTNYQWYNNNVAIAPPAGTQTTYVAMQTGNYYFTAVDVNGCIVHSDTVAVTVNQPPSTSFVLSPNRCAGLPFTIAVPNCVGCSFSWFVDGLPDPTVTNLLGYTIGTAPLTVGTHLIKVVVTNSFGCTAADSVTVTFFANPTVSIATAGPTPFCSNNLYTFTATTNAASPAWVWNYNNIPINLSTTNTLQASSAGTYTVYVTDGITGCTANASELINASPELNLFPVGCDTLCDTSHVFLPLGSVGGNLTGYTINWYDNAPPYLTPVGTGPTFNLNSLMPGSHNLSVIVIGPNGCADTSNVYSLYSFSCIILAVKDLNLGVRRMGDYGMLNWSVNEEWNNDYFMVEYSTDGTRFTDVARVNSRGNSLYRQQYAYSHLLPTATGMVFYRIRAVDKNGSISYSNTVQLKPGKGNAESLLVVPNITAGQATVSIYSNHVTATMLRLLDAQGRTVMSRPLTLAKGLNTLSLDLAPLGSGIYYVSVVAGDGVLTGAVVRR